MEKEVDKEKTNLNDGSDVESDSDVRESHGKAESKCIEEEEEAIGDATNMINQEKNQTTSLAKNERDKKIDKVVAADLEDTQNPNSPQSIEIINEIEMSNSPPPLKIVENEIKESTEKYKFDEPNEIVDDPDTPSIEDKSLMDATNVTVLEESDNSQIDVHFLADKTSNLELPPYSLGTKFHNLSILELRKTLAFCQICNVRHGNHKITNLCLAKHGKRQCWLCLDILPSRKEDFYRHCMDYHSISRGEDIVGCPFCVKTFDFRQGLNQHIVKIHFSESISDLESVASLSPTTLVDIFTGKPRSSSSSSEDFQPQFVQNMDDPSQMIGVDNSYQMTHTNPNSVHHKLDYNRHLSASVSESLQLPPYASLHCATSIDSVRPRPSVITLSGNNVQRMYVPPEQTLGSLELSRTSPQSLQQHISTYQAVEKNVEVMGNSSHRPQKYTESVFRSPRTNTTRSSETQVRRVPNSERYDPAVFSMPNESDTGSLESYNMVGKPNYYEQSITRVRTNAYVSENAGSMQQFISATNATANQPPGEISQRFGDMNKFFYASDNNAYQPPVDNNYADQSVPQNPAQMTSNQTLRQNFVLDMSYSGGNITVGKTSVSQDFQFQPPLPLDYSNPNRYPEHCGVKRKFLMKSMMDEHQFKKPEIIHSSHTLVQELQAAPVSLYQKSSSTKKLPNSKRSSYSQDSSVGGMPFNTQPKHIYTALPQTMPQTETIDVGPFFEKYVKEDLCLRSRPIRFTPPIDSVPPAINTSFDNTSNYWKPQPPYTPTGTRPCLNTHGNQFNPCTQKQTVPLMNTFSHNSYQFHSNNINPQVPPPPINGGANNLGQGPSRNRRQPNPAFWDSLYARVALSRRIKKESGHHTVRTEFHNTPTHFRLPGSCQPNVENVVIQNPFEEDSSLSGSHNGSINRHYTRRNNESNETNVGRPMVTTDNALYSRPTSIYETGNPYSLPVPLNSSQPSFRPMHHPSYRKSTCTVTSSSQIDMSADAGNMMMSFSPNPSLGKDETSQISFSPHLQRLHQQQRNLQHPPQNQNDPVKGNRQSLVSPRHVGGCQNITNKVQELDKSRMKST